MFKNINFLQQITNAKCNTKYKQYTCTCTYYMFGNEDTINMCAGNRAILTDFEVI